MFESDTTPSWLDIAFYSVEDKVLYDFVDKYNRKVMDNPTHPIKLWFDIQKCIGHKIGLSPKSPLKKQKAYPTDCGQDSGNLEPKLNPYPKMEI